MKHLNVDACRLGLQNLPSGHLVHQLSYAIGQYSIKDMLEHSSLVVLSQSTSGDSAILKFATDMPLNTGMANAKIDSTITYNYTHILKVSHEFIPVGLNDKHIIETEYQISNQNSPVEGLKIKVSTYISNTRVLQGTTAYVFNRVQTDLLSCDLSTYGIVAPSDDVYEDRGFNWPLWGGLGLFCLVLSATIAFIVRRRNRMKAEG